MVAISDRLRKSEGELCYVSSRRLRPADQSDVSFFASGSSDLSSQSATLLVPSTSLVILSPTLSTPPFSSDHRLNHTFTSLPLLSRSWSLYPVGRRRLFLATLCLWHAGLNHFLRGVVRLIEPRPSLFAVDCAALFSTGLYKTNLRDASQEKGD